MPLPLFIIGVLLGICYASLMLWYWYGWLATETHLNTTLTPRTSVSIIIAARNEEQHIGACLDSLVQQNYPLGLFEIIVVDDHSTDQTAEMVHRYEGIKLLHQHTTFQGKKKAIETGISNATGTLIITTDADCTLGGNWLASIANYYEMHQPAMIAAPVYFKQANSLLDIWQTLDFAGLMAITAASITTGLPQMCNGANLAYERSAFDEVNGFEGIDGIPTGDDVLLMMKLHHKYPGRIHFLQSSEAISWTQPQPTFASLASQRLRWVSKSKMFPDWRITAILVLAYFFNLLILVSLISGIWNLEALYLGLSLLGIKIALEFPLLWGSLKLPSQRGLLWHLPWVQVVYLLYVTVVGPLSLLGKYSWKGRHY